jgi:aminoglycoside 6'-N-acetyltransferase I
MVSSPGIRTPSVYWAEVSEFADAMIYLKYQEWGDRMKIVEVREDDFRAVKDLFLDVFSAEPWNDEWKSAEEVSRYLGELTQNSNSLSLKLVDDTGSIVAASLGYVFSWWQGKEYFIKEFFVGRDNQGQGYGSTFLELMSNYLLERGIKAIWLITDRDFPAYRFYIKNGFTEAEDLVFFQKTLEKR